MADYSTVATVKDYLGVPLVQDSEDDAITAALDAAEDRIDRWCGRTFVVPSGTTTRTLRPWSESVLYVPDIAQTDDLAVAVDLNDDGTAETALTSADYYVGPSDVAPFSELHRVSGRWPLPRSGRATVAVTAFYGYAMTVPDAVVQAATMLAARLYQRRSSPLGIAAGMSPEMGPVRIGRLDHDVAALLTGYRKLAVG